MEPTDPITAATHKDPYPYYAVLRDRYGDVEFHERLNLWVASKASVVLGILHEPSFRVRPLAEPVPRAVAGSPAGAVYGQLVRMNEGTYHASIKKALADALSRVDSLSLVKRAQWHARESAERLDRLDATNITDWTFDVPMRCIGELIGLCGWPDLTDRVREFAACLSPSSTPAQLTSASSAAEMLLTEVQEVVTGPAATTLLRDLQAAGLVLQEAGSDALASNIVGLFSQTLDATAGLIGNSLVALIRDPELQASVWDDESRIGPLVREVSRYDASVQNTRRFATTSAALGSSTIQPGDVILLVLGSAGRDEALYERPDSIDLGRPAGPVIGFGASRHQCPGGNLAFAVATGALRYVLGSGLPLTEDRIAWTYRASVSARVPQFVAT